MLTKDQKGFSLIELLIVVVVISVIAALAVPALQKGIVAAQNGSTFGSLRSLSSSQTNYYAQNNRFGRLTEINNLQGGAFGTPSGNDLIRGKYVLSMTPAVPTDAELRERFTVTATRNITGENLVFVYELTQAGDIRQILP